MKNLLCEFALRFPTLAAEILNRDRHKRRNFREETITDMLMAGLTAFESFGIIVDFPVDESKTGEDMDWEFVDFNAPSGRRYLRLHIQAKRAVQSRTKKPYWFYRELDHAAPAGAQKGTQHKSLVDTAKAKSGCIPLYMFYHPKLALEKGIGKVPSIEGVNVMFADTIPQNLTKGAWPIADKKIEKWRPHFMPLSSLLCFGRGSFILPMPGDNWFTLLFQSKPGFVSPGELADRLNKLRGAEVTLDLNKVEAINDIPQSTLRAIGADGSEKYVPGVERPRVIFYSNRTEES